jgi:hypothetical protein
MALSGGRGERFERVERVEGAVVQNGGTCSTHAVPCLHTLRRMVLFLTVNISTLEEWRLLGCYAVWLL